MSARARAPVVARIASALLRPRRPAPDDSTRLAAPSSVRRVLVVKTHDQLGDFLVATPAIRSLRERYPEARLALVTRAMIAPLAERNPHLDHVWVMPPVRGPGDLLRLARTLWAVAGFRPDVAVVLNSVSRSKTADHLALLSRARLIAGRSAVAIGRPEGRPAPSDPALRDLDPRKRAGSGAAPGRRDPVYDLDLPIAAASEHQVERYLDLVRWTGAAVSSRRLVLEPSEEERRRGREELEEALPGTAGRLRRVGIHPGAANPLKCWPLESFVELGTVLARPSEGPGGSDPDGEAPQRDEPRVALAVFDSPRERGRAAAVCAGLAARGAHAAFLPAGGIERFAALSAALDLLVCNDSGVMHVAAALGVPTISFHSLGRPREWAPRSPNAVAFQASARIAAIPVSAAVAAAWALLRGAPLPARPGPGSSDSAQSGNAPSNRVPPPIATA